MAKNPDQLEIAFVPHAYEGAVIEQRAKDGYINATAMCHVAGRPWSRYWESPASKEFANELASDIGMPISELIQIVKGGHFDRQGTWVHPQVAVHLAQWLSPKFAVLVSKWVYDWLSGAGAPTQMPYHLRRYVANQSNVPEGHFSVLTEIILGLVGPLEAQGYTLPEKLWPDISQGRMFAKWLRDTKGVDTDAMPTYAHEFEDGRPDCAAKAYPIELLPDFRRHFTGVWMKERSRQYFLERDPSALPYLERLLAPPAKPKALPPVFRGRRRVREDDEV